MKQLLLQTIACCAVLLPFSQLEAKTYGGFKPGKTFTMTVEEKITAKTVGTKVLKNVPVPAGVPNYKKGQRVKFTIGAAGQLTAKGMSIPFKEDGGSANVYNKVVTTGAPKADTGEVFKTATNKPTNVALMFNRTTVSLSGATVTTVTYTFE
jgi:hypothetical protein